MKIRIVACCDKCSSDIEETEQFYYFDDEVYCSRCFEDKLVQIEREAEESADALREEILSNG